MCETGERERRKKIVKHLFIVYRERWISFARVKEKTDCVCVCCQHKICISSSQSCNLPLEGAQEQVEPCSWRIHRVLLRKCQRLRQRRHDLKGRRKEKNIEKPHRGGEVGRSGGSGRDQVMHYEYKGADYRVPPNDKCSACTCLSPFLWKIQPLAPSCRSMTAATACTPRLSTASAAHSCC